jgi:putative membrane protein
MKTTYMKPHFLLGIPALFAAASLSISAIAVQPAASPGPSKPSEIPPHDNSVKEKLTNASFVAKAATGGMTEVEISKIAAEKSTNKKIKKFANSMVKDHETANTKLKEIATANRLDIPARLDPAHQKMVDELKSLSGAQLDQTYVNLMKKDHDTTVALFDNAAGEPTLLPELRVFANKALPTLREHQKHAHALSASMPSTAAR